MKKLESYILEEKNMTPTLEDVTECVRIAKENDCIVELIWVMKWSGTYKRLIYSDDDPQDVYDHRLPHVYGL